MLPAVWEFNSVPAILLLDLDCLWSGWSVCSLCLSQTAAGDRVPERGHQVKEHGAFKALKPREGCPHPPSAGRGDTEFKVVRFSATVMGTVSEVFRYCPKQPENKGASVCRSSV